MLRNRSGQLRLRLDLSEIGISKILRLNPDQKGVNMSFAVLQFAAFLWRCLPYLF